MVKEKFIKIFEQDRKLLTAKFTIFFAFLVSSVLAIYSYIDNNIANFYLDGFIFLVLLASHLLFSKKNIYLTSNMALFIMTIGVLFLIYTNKGTDGVIIWIFPLAFFYMFSLGHKLGAILSGIVFLTVFYMMYGWMGDSFTKQFYIRYVFASLTAYVFSFAYEYIISTTIEKLKISQKNLIEMTRIDSLTTLFNRRYFDEIFPKQIKIAKRNNKLLVFAMADIDNFKNYNDTYGHQAGDEVLKAVSLSFLNSIQRTDDYVFRLGGEEFGMLFFTERKEDALELAKKACLNVKDLKIAHSENSASPYVTVSIGIYVIKPRDNYDYDEIFKMADDAMYGAKQKGKNRVELL